MYKDKQISVVVPAYNEETQIEKVVATMPDLVDKIIIVNDCSTDATKSVVEGLAEKDARVVLVNHEVNQGVGGAIATGYMWSRDHEIDISVVMAGDAQMDPKDLTNIIDPVADDIADYSKANRLITGDAYNQIPKIRFFGNSVLSLMTKIASGYWNVSDSQTGYTAINRKALETIDWSKMYKRYGQPNDLLVKLNIHDFRVVDVPTEPVYHVGEKSGIKIHKVIFTIGTLLVKLFFLRMFEKYYKRDFHPLIFFYAFGLGMLVLSSLFFVRMLALWWQVGDVPEITMVAWIFTLSISFNSMFFAMWFDYETNKHLSFRIDKGNE
jgi:glycosyltransferase involved in cell wall biosynthesis